MMAIVHDQSQLHINFINFRIIMMEVEVKSVSISGALSRKVWKSWACCQVSAFSLLHMLYMADEWCYVLFPLWQNSLFFSVVILGEQTQASQQPHTNWTRKFWDVLCAEFTAAGSLFTSKHYIFLWKPKTNLFIKEKSKNVCFKVSDPETGYFRNINILLSGRMDFFFLK